MATTGKKITCRAAVIWKVNTPYVIETVELEPPKDGEVRVKLTSSGICHTDLHFQEGCWKDFPFPTVFGHESAGIVESIGPGVKSMCPGYLVVLLFERYCGECKICKSQKTNLCDNQPKNHWQSDGKQRFTCKGQHLSQLYTLGTFSKYTVLSEQNVTKVNPQAPRNKIGLVGCCIVTGYGAIVKCANVEAGSTCAIWGLGGVGMNVVMGCRDSKASKVIGVDVNPQKFELAKELGCTHVINPKDRTKNVRVLSVLYTNMQLLDPLQTYNVLQVNMHTEGKKISCRAAVIWKVNTPYVIETIEVDPPKAGEVRIKLTSAGICHSDSNFQEGCVENFPFPTVLGHEGSGFVESVGLGVKSVKPGDLVVLVFERYCGECKSCINPKAHHCDNQPRNNWQSDGKPRFTCKGQPLSQLLTLGSFSEYTVVSEQNVTKVNSRAPSDKIALASCCIPTGYGAAVKCAKVEPGATCAIWGLGGVGMNIIMGCRDSKASQIIGVDINPRKFKIAKELGCTYVINPKDCTKSVPEVLAELTDGGVDYCFASIGSTDAMEQAFQSSHPYWGETIIIGFTDASAKIKVGIWELLFGRKVRGDFYGSYKAWFEIPKLVEKIMKNEIQLDKLVSHVIPLDDINHGYNMLKTGESLRTVIDFNLKK